MKFFSRSRVVLTSGGLAGVLQVLEHGPQTCCWKLAPLAMLKGNCGGQPILHSETLRLEICCNNQFCDKKNTFYELSVASLVSRNTLACK